MVLGQSTLTFRGTLLCCAFALGSVSLADEPKADVRIGPAPLRAVDIGSLNFEGATKSQSVEVGFVEVGQAIHFSVNIRNRAPFVLKFRRPKSSCGRLSAIPAGKKIAADTDGRVYLTFRPKETGEFEKYLVLGYGDTDLENIRVIIKGIAKSRFDLRPTNLDTSKGDQQRFQLVANFGTVRDVRSISSSSALIRAVSIVSKGSDRLTLSMV